MTTYHIGNDVFEVDRNLMEVTSMRRPDVGRVLTDCRGHKHPWCGPDGVPAARYDPSVSYTMPSLTWVKDGEEYYEDDDEPHDVGHWECRECGEHIVPPYTADTHPQYVAGILRCRVNGESVTREEFMRRIRADYLGAKIPGLD